jgi:hypothetical protein
VLLEAIKLILNGERVVGLSALVELVDDRSRLADELCFCAAELRLDLFSKAASCSSKVRITSSTDSPAAAPGEAVCA